MAGIWKGAISFGLVHVPVSIHPATSEIGIDFDMLDKRSMDPIGYKRINKRTGEEMDHENIVKGIKQENGEYVILSDDEIKAAYPKTTQTIEIESFVHAAEIPFVYLEKPYFLEPLGKSEKVYALLRDSMSASGVIGIARVVMHNKEHLAALMPSGAALILNTLRWSNEVRETGELALPPANEKGANFKAAEMKMAQQLIGQMTTTWEAAHYSEHFRDAIMALVEKRLRAGKTEKVSSLEEPAEAAPSNILDLTELLKKSLKTRSTGTHAAMEHGSEEHGRHATKKPMRKQA